MRIEHPSKAPDVEPPREGGRPAHRDRRVHRQGAWKPSNTAPMSTTGPRVSFHGRTPVLGAMPSPDVSRHQMGGIPTARRLINPAEPSVIPTARAHSSMSLSRLTASPGHQTPAIGPSRSTQRRQEEAGRPRASSAGTTAATPRGGPLPHVRIPPVSRWTCPGRSLPGPAMVSRVAMGPGRPGVFASVSSRPGAPVPLPGRS